MSRHIREAQLLLAKEESVDRLAQYLGIDTTGLTKEDMASVVAMRILFYTAPSINFY
jgi:hypothetical protein